MKHGSNPSPILHIIIFEVLLFFPLCIPPFSGRALVFFPLLCAVYCCIITSSLGNPSSDWSLALAITPQLLKALDVWVLTNAEIELRRVDSVNDNSIDFGFGKKIWWAIELISIPRGVGWNWEMPYICYTGTASRRDAHPFFHHTVQQ